jgi:hypothetical protein
MSSTAPLVARLRALLVAALAVLLLATLAVPSVAAPPSHANAERAVTVMTRNLYLGASLGPLFPEGGFTGDTAQLDALLAATAVWDQVRRTDFPTRAGALADEVVAHEPDLLGLQEVTLYRVGPFNPFAPATEVRLDFLEVLQSELRARGQHYDVVVSQEAFDGELTGFDWGVLPFTAPPIDVRLTDRDVILVRRTAKATDLKVHNPRSGLFAAYLPLTVLGQPLPIVRAWTSVDVAHRSRNFRFINTHLEAFSQEVATAQAAELLAGPAATPMPVVLTGDFNSRPTQSAYESIVAAGFTDVAVGGPPTCCFDDDLADLDSELETRIDLIFTRGPFSAQDVTMVGDEPFRTDQAPYFASDHAGLFAKLLLDPTAGKKG